MSPIGRQADETAVAGPLTRPPLLFLASLLLGMALDRLLPLPLPDPGMFRWAAGTGLIFIGVAIVIVGARNFARAATPVPSNQPVRALVTTGIHGFSRNPIYLGMCLLYAGIGIAVHAPWILILGLPLVIVLRYAVVAREEAYLERRFEDAYRDYKAHVRRWL